jgi:UDP-N-acetylglucosamine 2-epimerase (non-hydrolysing)
MKCLVILGTRPEAIRLYHTIKELNPYKIFWTGQNFSKNLSTDIIQDPRFDNIYKDMVLSSIEETDFFQQFTKMLLNIDSFIKQCSPDKILILGDTNSSLAAALAAKKNDIPLYHMEAGNRCYNPKSPEEINRRMIDSIADVHLCYTKFAKQNLLNEGVPLNKIHVIGNPMAEFPELHSYSTEEKSQVLVTLHRKENEEYLPNLLTFFNSLNSKVKVKLVLHPRYYKFFAEKFTDVVPSVNFSDFVKLQQESSLIITDSGTVCEEAAILKKPCLIIRETTERPELLELGSTILGDIKNTDNLLSSSDALLNLTRDWDLPDEYKYQKVSKKVKTILLSKENYI